MKKSELKSLLKPLVKECISEVLIETNECDWDRGLQWS